MGVYRYAARAPVRNICNVDMAAFQFSYKPWGGYDEPGYFARAVAAKEDAARRAADKLNAAGVKYMVYGGFPKKGEYSELWYYPNGNIPAMFYDGGDPAGNCERVGYLVNKGRGKVFISESQPPYPFV